MYLKNYNFRNKTAIVTGAGKGIGRACAIALAEAGANLIIISRTKKDLDEVSKKIKKLKVKCKSYVCDIKNYNKITVKQFIVANVISVAILLFIFKLLLPSTLKLFGYLEVFFVNSVGLPFNSGTIVAALIIISVFSFSL